MHKYSAAAFAVVLVFLGSCATTSVRKPAEVIRRPAPESAQKVILDCDNSMGSFFWEVDDGLVIAYLLNKPDADLLGITTCFGNRTYDHRYTDRLLAEAGRTDIPSLKGAQSPEDPPTQAARFLAETAAEHPGEITLIAAGPVTNLRAAAELDPDFYSNLKRIVVMGGITGELVFGSREVAELNLSADHVASYQMLTSGCPVTVMTAQFCLNAPFARKDLELLTDFPLKWKRYLRCWLVTMRIGVGLNEFILWDLVPTVYVFHPEYFVDRKMVLLSGKQDLETGLLVLSDEGNGPAINAPAFFADVDAFYDDLFDTWNRQGGAINRTHR